MWLLKDLGMFFVLAFLWSIVAGRSIALTLIGAVILAAWACYRHWRREFLFRKSRTIYVEEKRRR